MFQTIRAARAARRARAAYELTLIEMLMAENARRLAELREPDKCPWCEAMESPKQRAECEHQFGRCPDDCPAI